MVLIYFNPVRWQWFKRSVYPFISHITFNSWSPQPGGAIPVPSMGHHIFTADWAFFTLVPVRMIGSTDPFAPEINQMCKASELLGRILCKAKNCSPVNSWWPKCIEVIYSCLWTLLKISVLRTTRVHFGIQSVIFSQWKSRYVSNLFPRNCNREGPGYLNSVIYLFICFII